MKRRHLGGLLIATGAMALLGRGGARAADKINVKLGILPIVPQAPVFIAKERGFFDEEGLNISTQSFQGGAEIGAAAISGDLDFGYGTAIQPIIGFSQGAPIRIVAPSDIVGSDPANYVNVLLVRGDSDIKKFADLQGKRVAVNQFKGLIELLVRTNVDLDGGDSSKVTFVEVPFSQMASLLKQKQVDAVANAEPFVQPMLAAGDRALAHVAKSLEGAPLGIWFASAAKAHNTELLGKFRRAIGKANLYASKNPEEVRKAIPTFTRIGPEVAAKIALPVWTQTLDMALVQREADLLAKYKFTDQRIDVSKVIVK